MAIAIHQELTLEHPLAAAFTAMMRERVQARVVLRASTDFMCGGDLLLYAALEPKMVATARVTITAREARPFYELLIDAALILIAGLPIHDRYWPE